MESPSLEVFKTALDTALSNLLYSEMSCQSQGQTARCDTVTRTSDQCQDQACLMEQLALKDMFNLEVLNWPVFRLVIQSALPHAPEDISDVITCVHMMA
ncbi:hypothetical protein QYF61_003095 [Mycteria americana]|uniref:Uncharacterized protein n=1 Tax=Mycteria americana TaxID=33587 RepID=A0AAN7RYT2_MYCAM|nr:hypothetical protein QYF61_003095 [Mycteria americana]